VRALRHELGDFLQKVYASIAILKDRLPPDREMEQGVLDRLWSRSESCRRILDTAHDFICRITLDYQPVDLTQMATLLTARAREKNPSLLVTTEGPPEALVLGDRKRIQQVGELLLANACEAAAKRIDFCTRVEPAQQVVEWTIINDGPGLDPTQSEYLFRPFFTTRPGHCGLGLALAKKLVGLHGGNITAGSGPQGGFQVQVAWPAKGAGNSK
jgi:signal transduction histidine kinase